MRSSENVQFIGEKATVVIVAANHQQPKWDRTAFRRQFFAALSAIIGSISFGMSTGFSATLLSELSRSGLILVDESTESWIASTTVLSMPLGLIMSSLTMRYLGRKKGQIIIFLPWTCGWICVSLATNLWTLLAGCVLLGIGAGGHSLVSTVYIGETSEPRFRGLIGLQISLGVAFGIMLSHLQGIFLHWRIAMGMSSVFPLVAFAIILFAPESPTWLVLRGRVETAKKIFMWLRNDALESENELNTLISKATEYSRSEDTTMKKIFSKSFLKPFFILIVLFFIQQGSGLNVLVFYTVKMFSSMSDNIDTNTSIIVVDTVRLVAVLGACILVKMTGRRQLYFSSAFASLVSLGGVIACLVFRSSNVMMIFFTCAYIWFLYVGVSPIPWIMVGELYPANLKEIGCCISTFFAFFSMFVVVKTAPLLMLHLGVTLMFTIYGTIVVVGVIILFYVMPETNNITLQQVEENMKS